MNSRDAQTSARNPIARFFLVPFEARTYTNLLYLALAFPLGLFYFILLTVGLSLGIGLTIIWIGLLILVLTFLTSWGLAALERGMAIGLLGAEIPPMGPAPVSQGQGFLNGVQAFLANPVTWKGMLFLLLKLPLGVISFTALVTLSATSLSFVLFPFAFFAGFSEVYEHGVLWWVDTPGEAILCGLFGALLSLASLHALNGLAAVNRLLAAELLGSERFAEPPPAPLLQEPAPAA